MTTGQAPTRRDARRNRDLLVATARRLFAERGLDVTLKEVAREAGVGVGTVYRHFPDKDALVTALFSAQLDDEVLRAQSSAQAPDAWQALVGYLTETMRLQAANKGLRALMCPQGSAYGSVRECKALMNPHLRKLVASAHGQGTLRPDCTLDDIVHLQVALVAIMDATEPESGAYERHLAHFLAGVHASEARSKP